LNWPANAPGNRRFVKSLDLTFRLLDRKNTTNTYNPQTTVVVGNSDGGSCAHPLGGAVIEEACDLYGRIIGYQGLYVVDGALIPGSTACANPALTIAAMAERCMERIIAEDM
jgi:cholesterol oxidase